jgi:hypothetical protein
MTTTEAYTEDDSDPLGLRPRRVRCVIAGEPIETSEDIPGAYTSPHDFPGYIPPSLETAWSLGDRSHGELHLSKRTNPFDPVFQPDEHAAWIKGWDGLPLQRGV